MSDQRRITSRDDDVFTDAQTAPVLPMILEWAEKLPKAEGWVWCGKWGGSVYPTERHSHASSDCPGPHHELRVARELSATDQPDERGCITADGTHCWVDAHPRGGHADCDPCCWCKSTGYQPIGEGDGREG